MRPVRVSQDFIYRPLKGNCIRILVLQPSIRYHGALIGQLSTVSLDSTVTYDAISYTWGNLSYRGSMILNGYRHPISGNLERALHQLRDVTKVKRLWVDAVSINMDDLTERSAQILRMRQIFGRAEKVIAWLGEEADESHRALQFLEEATRVTDNDEVLRGRSAAASWRQVRTLLNRQ
jgi:hypothetical protein